MSRRVLCVLVAAAFSAALYAAPLAEGARGWHPPVVLGPGLSPKVAANADGIAAVAWLSDGNVQAAVRSGGAWSGAQSLGPAGNEAPDVEVDPAGNVVVVWERRDYVIEAAVKPAGGSWLPSEAISSPGVGWPLGAQVAVDAEGTATAIWFRPVAFGDLRVESAVRPASAGQWQPSVEIGRGVNPDLAVRFDGSAVAVWSAWPGDYVIQAAVRPAGGAWLAPMTLSGPASVFIAHPKLAVDGPGNATALWPRVQDPGMVLQTTRLPFGSPAWEPLATLATGRLYGYNAGISGPQLGVNAAGAAVSAWAQWDGDQWVRAAYRPAGSGWQAPQHLSQRGEVEPAVAIDSAGNALVVWRRTRGTNLDGSVEASFRDVATGIWTSPLRISGVGGAAPDLASAGASGDAVAVWTRYLSSTSLVVEAAEFAEGGTPPPPGPPPGPGPPPPDPPPGSPPPPGRCVVPGVIGLRLAAARSTIRRSRCAVGSVRRRRSGRVRRGRVIAQSPRRGAIRPYRAGVKLVVSRGAR